MSTYIVPVKLFIAYGFFCEIYTVHAHEGGVWWRRGCIYICMYKMTQENKKNEIMKNVIYFTILKNTIFIQNSGRMTWFYLFQFLFPQFWSIILNVVFMNTSSKKICQHSCIMYGQK